MPPEPTKAKLKRKSSRREVEDFRFDGGHAREIEQKRINGQISCAECRRLKIKCDKQIPCQSCQRRGCAALCPNGSLATGQGTRFVLAATEHLHRRISKMSERIRQLEDALASLQSQHSTEPHPLLRDDLLGVNQDRDDDYAGLTEDAPGPSNPPELIDTFGTLSITDHGISRFFGPTGGSECLLMSDNVSSRESSNSQTPERQRDSKSPSLPQKVVMFSHAFPFTPMGPVAEVRELIEGQLPSWERARYLSESYLDGAAWLFRGVNRDQLMDEILPVYYSSSSVKPVEEHNSAHELALLFVVFAVGALVDLTQEPGNVEAEHYHQIARAAICLQPVLEKPSLTTIQALHLLSVYNAMSGNEFSSKEASMETTWSLIILAAHLSQTIGLHRDSVKWGLPPKVVQRRRGLFWDIFVADAWHALSTGRPPSFSLAYIDCRYPETRSSRPPGQGDDEANFDTWNFRFAAECVAEVASRTLTAETPTYATIMELDRKVREFPIPESAAAMATSVAGTPMMTVSEDNQTLSDSMGNCTLSHTREVTIIEFPVNPLKSPYAPSFLAAYRASSTILRTIQAQFVAAPALCSRFWTMWTFAFSAAIVFGTIVTRGPRSPLASNAMTELDNACILFSKAAAHSPRAARALPILTKLSEKAHHALSNVQSGQSSASQGQFWSLKEEEGDDELAIFSGRTRFVSAKRAAPQTPSEPVDQPVQMSDPPYAPPPPPPPSHSAEPTPPVSYYPERASTTPSMRNWMQEQPSHYAQRREYVPNPETTVPSHVAPPYQTTRLCYYPHTPQNHQPQAPQPQPQHHRHQPHSHSQPQQAQHPHHQREQGPSVSGPSDFTWRSQANIPQQYNDSAFPVSQPHGATYQQQQQQQQHYDSSSSTAFNAQHVKPPPELTELGLVSQDSRLDERWASFMQDSGYLDGFSYRTR
ncbi:hypothetical protein SERLA73DRAFT_75787 [Serpula lacrymans var. lacrymans S7.3]|uniref:Zn(2)-C6 fungal-type domain-containing protein n=1 Tax=Serpula lacrymans var. lacrymans (strain S7.3) TaxID=936435 RepID=F8Q485_SERL3|nr:hypothetical protein SERLA73DRAFT_75787 [Serpula lacrymans var. lacrymans S7.3]